MALLDNIIGCWSPSVRGSGYLLPDLSGRGNHGILTNMDAGTDWPGAAVRGVHGRVLDFDGTDDYVARTSPQFELVSPFTVSVWYRPVIRRLYGGIVSTFNAFSELATSGWIIYDGSGGNNGAMGLILGGVICNTASGNSVLNEWQQYVAVFRQGAAKLYRNGAQQALSATNLGAASYTGTTQLKIGSYTTASGRNSCQIGEVAIYNGELTQPDAVELYRRGNGAIGRMLTGQTRRTVYGSGLRFQPAWVTRRSQIIGGGLR